MTGTLHLTLAGVCLMMVPGFWLRRRGVLSEAGTAELARLLVRGVYPFLIFASVVRNYRLPELAAAWPLPLVVFLLMLGGYAVGLAAAVGLRFRAKPERHAFLFQCGFNNYSFLPLPLVQALFPEQAGRAVAALIVSSFGAELAVWTLGVGILTGGRVERRALRHLISPPLLALLLGTALVVWRDTGFLSAWLRSPHLAAVCAEALRVAGRIGEATVPLAMVVAGSCLAVLEPAVLRNPRVWIATGLRVLLIPLLAYAVLSRLPLPADGQVLFVVAAMPSAIASITLTKVYGGDEPFAAGTVLLTHLCALVTVPLFLRTLAG
jgi:hypothetical protein